MRVSLQWLKELVAGPADAFDAPTLADRLSMAGFEVDALDDLAARAHGVVVGLVEQREPHPNADKLSVCQVRINAEQRLQIVCGATNVRAGIHVPVALVGTTLAAVQLTIKSAELRGVASSGMICSLAELGLAEHSEGIAILDDLLERVPALGSPVGPSLGLDDQVLELAITANRPDGLSMLGIAREVAALIDGQVRVPQTRAVATALPLPVPPASQTAMEAGGLFSITALSGVRVQPSPLWIRRRLETAGIRPINNVVDITNLVMLETGQPLHAYDAARLLPDGAAAEPGALGLRQGRSGEGFTGLDGEAHSLDSETLVVTYADRPIALAGVIGGLAEGVRDDTQMVWLEAAVFAADQVRRSARRLGLRSEASSRFEKGLPVEACLPAADRAVQLLEEICSARLEGRWLHQRCSQPREPIHLRRDALHNLLGPVQQDGGLEDLADARIERTLQAIGCALEPAADGEGWQVLPPAARAIDLRREVDLIEEVARLVGYDQFACHLPDPIEPGGLTACQEAERRLRRSLCTAGLQEACSLSLVPAAEGRLPLANPLLADYGHLRDGLHAELLSAAVRNLQAGQPGFWAFEIGTVFGDSEPLERGQQLAGVICGERRAERWRSSGKPRPPHYFEARGLVQQAFASLGMVTEDRPLQDHHLLHPGRAATILLEGRPLGWFGQLHPRRAAELNLPESCHLFQLELGALLRAATRRNRWQPVFTVFPTVPASERDLAVVVPADTSCQALLQVIRKAGKPLLEKAELIDRFDAEQLGPGRCSQAFRLRYRDPQRTLTDADVDRCHNQVRSALERQCGAELRS